MCRGSTAESDFLRALASELRAARHGARGALLARACAQLQCSKQSLYAKLRSVGWSSGRKLRADRGDSAVTANDALEVSSIMQASVRGTGKRLLDVGQAMEIARANGRAEATVSPGQMLRVMRRLGVHPSQLAQPTPYTPMRTEHPNQVWQLDASICVLYYLRGGNVGVMDEREFYKNKPANIERVADKRVLRYAVTDHYSGALFARYYNVTGENQQTLFEFLMEAMQPRAEFLMHGVPFVLIWDAGAANTAHAIRNLLDALEIRHWPHVPGNPRAKGQVERTHDLIERKFEGRLPFMEVTSLEQLNAALDVWQRDFNGLAIHTRHEHARWGMWQTIRVDQLRLCPPVELCQSLLFAKPERRRVKGNLMIQFAVKGYESAFYSVAHVPGVRVGDEIIVTVNAYKAPSIFVIAEDEHGATRYHCCDPTGRDQAGFFIDAPVFGQDYRAPADTDVDTARKDTRERAYGTRDANEVDAAKRKGRVAFNGEIDPLKDLRDRAHQVPDHIRRSGTALDVPSPVQVVERPLDIIEALQELRVRLCRPLSRQEAAHVRGWYPDGIPETDLDAIAARLTQPAPAERPRLVAIK